MAKKKSKSGTPSKNVKGGMNTQLKAQNKKSSINVKKLKVALSKQQSSPLNRGKKVTESKQTPQKPSQKPSPAKKADKNISIGDEAKNRLESAHFRYLNEQLYTSRSSDAWDLFQEDPQSFYTYHKGFANQVAKWPVNPLDLIIKELKKEPKDFIFADFGCGEARLSESVDQQVHSFDLVAANDRVTACDMANVPLENRSVNVVIFCLSLMGTNVNDFLIEANRVLTVGGMLYIAEVESRCQDVKAFTKSIGKFGYKLKQLESKHQYFFLAKLTKTHNTSKKFALPRVQLKPCLYKKR